MTSLTPEQWYNWTVAKQPWNIWMNHVYPPWTETTELWRHSIFHIIIASKKSMKRLRYTWPWLLVCTSPQTWWPRDIKHVFALLAPCEEKLFFHAGIPSPRTNSAKLWRLLRCYSEQADEQTVELLLFERPWRSCGIIVIDVWAMTSVIINMVQSHCNTVKLLYDTCNSRSICITLNCQRDTHSWALGRVIGVFLKFKFKVLTLYFSILFKKKLYDI